jgi:predicted acylesterase/phospholipase RssA
MTDARAEPAQNCDLVLQGGFASGVVYPRAIARIARDYRFRSLGGASAGAIGAALAAAAELGRATGGFERLETVVDELGSRLRELFVPEPPTRVLFDALIGALSASHAATGPRAKAWAAARVVAGAYRGRVALGAAGGILLVLLGVTAIVLGIAQHAPAAGWVGGVVAVLGGVVIGVLLIVVLVAGRIARTVTVDLVANGFGLVGGWGSAARPGFAAWIDTTMSSLAGRDASITFGDLAEAGVDLRTITTDLSLRRLHELPAAMDRFWFDADDWRHLFHDAIVDRLVAASPEQRGQLHRMPTVAQVPVIVAVRLSLSFSGVISAVPMYTERDGDLVLDWFSDGGIVSNFPVHLFDSPSPRWPTFAIMLGGVLEDYDGPLWDIGGVDDLPRDAVRTEIADIASFGHSVLGAAMSWYDESYLPLPGYRDRIARVMLRPSEGGLNLDMPASTISSLAQRGWDAADALVRRFTEPVYDSPTPTGWDHHAWMRHRAFVATLPPLLEGWRRGRATIEAIPLDDPPGVPLDPAARALLLDLRARLDEAADAVLDAPEEVRAALLQGIEPPTQLRRTNIL